MSMEDFNSSDLEFSSPEDNGARVGARAKASMINKSALDRLESKKTLKTLSDVGNAPDTTIAREFWFELFKHFASVTLRIDTRANKTPTANDIIRFIARLPSHLQSRHSDGKIAYSVIKNAEFHLVRALAFHYAGYKLSRHDSLRVSAIIQTLLNDGVITKDPIREKQWLTCQIVMELVTAVLKDAVQNGTKSWDMTLAGTFSLVLQAALSSKSGDFNRSAHYAGEEHIKWEDIVLVATVQDGKVRMKMLVTLLWRKGHKGDRSNAMSVELGQLDEPNSVVDPTKLCVAYALRIGLVKETNWPDLMDAVLSRPNKSFIWTRPKSPVFYGLTRSQQLDFTKPAPIGQQRRFLYHAAQLTGMPNMPVTHDIRRGAAADIYALRPDFADVDRVPRALGHTVGSMVSGVTEEYIGRDRVDLWATRLNADAASDPFGVQTAPTALKKRKIETKDIDNYSDKNVLNRNDRNDRYQASNNLSKAQYDQWMAHQLTVQPPTPEASTAQRVVASESRDGNTKHLPLKGITNESIAGRTTYESDDEDAEECHVLENTDSSIREFSNTVLGAEANSDGYDDVESMTSGCIVLWQISRADAPAVLETPTDQFIKYLSTVNLVSVSSENLPEDVPSDGSRDVPTAFLYHCKQENCTRTFKTPLLRDKHQVNCCADTIPPVSTSTKPNRKRKPQHIN